MNRMKLWLPATLAGAALSLTAQAPTKIAIIHLQNAIIGTKDGQKAAKELETRFMPKRQEIEKRQGEIQSLQQQLRASSNTASEEQKNKLMRDIDIKQKALQRGNIDRIAVHPEVRAATGALDPGDDRGQVVTVRLAAPAVFQYRESIALPGRQASLGNPELRC